MMMVTLVKKFINKLIMGLKRKNMFNRLGINKKDSGI